MKVKCPHCQRETEYDSANKYRPFCSERCATLDLGAWADEKYKVPAEESPSEEDSVNENDEQESQSRQDLPPHHLLN